MITRNNRCAELRYRKRPDPHRVVLLSSLRRTESPYRSRNYGELVSNTGILTDSDSWKPIESGPISVEVSPKSWRGLHSRVLSNPILAEVS
ncbi:MAG: hypothetical protein CMB67_02765 [Euryarchaeota archaeon]|nr:hypothetical protein [Euryarchaeota archaeon]